MMNAKFTKKTSTNILNTKVENLLLLGEQG
jgi:hypothetical protein